MTSNPATTEPRPPGTVDGTAESGVAATDLARDHLDRLLSAEERALRERVREFVDERIRPNIAGWYEAAPPPGDRHQDGRSRPLLLRVEHAADDERH